MSISDRLFSRNLQSPSAASDLSNILVGVAATTSAALFGAPTSVEVGQEFFTQQPENYSGFERLDMLGKADLIGIEATLLLGTVMMWTYGVSRTARGAEYLLNRVRN